MDIKRGSGKIPSEYIVHPFGRGDLTTDGVQYGSANATAGDTDGFVVVETATINCPTGSAEIDEVEFGLASGCYGSNTTGSINVKWQAQNSGATGWDDLNTAVSSTSSTDAATPELDVVTGIIDATGGDQFTGKNPYLVRLVVQSASTG
jgi:hypothetical protein